MSKGGDSLFSLEMEKLHISAAGIMLRRITLSKSEASYTCIGLHITLLAVAVNCAIMVKLRFIGFDNVLKTADV